MRAAKQAKSPYSKRALIKFWNERTATARSWCDDVLEDALLACNREVDENMIAVLEEQLRATITVKPRRTASGVATITVITKPWPCSGACIYCPNDMRMPKSYLHNEPACLRAEENFFDPYLQVASRLIMLARMGHAIDKVELIVLGGTWNEYPAAYRTWFVREMFRALNDCDIASTNPKRGTDEITPGTKLPDDAAYDSFEQRRARYVADGATSVYEKLDAYVAAIQAEVDAGEKNYNDAWPELWGTRSAAARSARWQVATHEELIASQKKNESATSRVVGLVFETRPDAITPATLLSMRTLGATKVQIGIQSLDQAILDDTKRNMKVETVARAFELLRLFGFKIHIHFMVNLPGATPEADKADFAKLVSDSNFLPDEIKLYPCALIAGTGLERRYHEGTWAPYKETDLVDVLVADVLKTPAWMRISRMIRDFSTQDVMAGNEHPNLRQQVEAALAAHASEVQEIRFREIATARTSASELKMEEVAFTTSLSDEKFLQWVTPDGHIAGFLRLCLPHEQALANLKAAFSAAKLDASELPLIDGCAMIREVHVYGMAAQLGEKSFGAQHRGLGSALVERAVEIAREHGYMHLRVISSVGTRNYYRKLGFYDAGLYQEREI